MFLHDTVFLSRCNARACVLVPYLCIDVDIYRNTMHVVESSKSHGWASVQKQLRSSRMQVQYTTHKKEMPKTTRAHMFSSSVRQVHSLLPPNKCSSSLHAHICSTHPSRHPSRCTRPPTLSLSSHTLLHGLDAFGSPHLLAAIGLS